MATDFRIRGGQSAIQNLKSLSTAEARVLLKEIQAQIETPKGVKSGVLKLVNLSDGSKNVTLERKSLLQRMFLRDGRDMRTTADTLKGLFEKAGVSEQIQTELGTYLQARSNRAGTRSIARLIDSGLKTVGAVSGDSVEAVLKGLGIERVGLGANPASGSYGVVGGASRSDRNDRIYKDIALLKGDKPNAKALTLSPLTDSLGRPRLERTGSAGSAYIGRGISGIVRPEVYVLTERRFDGTTRFHAVEGDKNLKRWAADHLNGNTGSTLHVTGVLMKKAQGEEMLGATLETAADRAALHKSALDGLKTLKQMAQRGFVHGDIKPENTFLDRNAGTAQFIDADTIAKMRREEQDGTPIQAVTPYYAHPLSCSEPYRVGFEQDLFSWGMSILVKSLPNTEEGKARASNLMNAVYGYNAADQRFWKADDQGYETLRANLRNALNNPPAFELTKTQIMALNWIDAALDCSSPVTQRYGEPARGRNAEHLLDRIDPSKHPRVATRLDRPLGPPAAPQPNPASRVAHPNAPAKAPALGARRAQQNEVNPAGGAAQGDGAAVRDVKQAAAAKEQQRDLMLRSAIEGAIEQVYLQLEGQDDSIVLPKNNGKVKAVNLNAINEAVSTWATGEGFELIDKTLRDLPPNTAAYRSTLANLIEERANLEHLRLLVSLSDDYKNTSPDEKARFEKRIISTVNRTPLLTTAQIIARINR